jgi:phosphoglycerate dehydrogenase-like enzyme
MVNPREVPMRIPAVKCVAEASATSARCGRLERPDRGPEGTRRRTTPTHIVTTERGDPCRRSGEPERSTRETATSAGSNGLMIRPVEAGRMSDSPPDVAVLRQKIHGMPAADYAAALRERLPEHGVRLARTPEAERDAFAARVVTGHRVDSEQLDAGMEVFACSWAGTDHLPVDDLADAGVAVTNAAGVHGPNVAEHAIGSILAFTRGFDVAWQRKREREWRSFQAAELQGSTVTVVGLGAIGESIVSRLDGFGVDTVGVRYTPGKGGPTDEVYGFEAVHEAFAESDYLVLACPLTDTTEGLIDREAFETLPAEAVVVNVARGPVVDTDALVWALRRNHIRGAALDVTDPEPLPEDHPLWNFGNVLITPHNAGHTPAYYERLADIVAENVRRLDDGDDDLVNRVV